MTHHIRSAQGNPLIHAEWTGNAVCPVFTVSLCLSGREAATSEHGVYCLHKRCVWKGEELLNGQTECFRRSPHGSRVQLVDAVPCVAHMGTVLSSASPVARRMISSFRISTSQKLYSFTLECNRELHTTVQE